MALRKKSIAKQIKLASEQRDNPRLPSFIIAEYTVNEGTFRDVIKNIGASGLSVRTDRKIGIGQPISIEFPLFQFDYTTQVSGVIVRKDHNEFAVTFDKPIPGLSCKDGLIPVIVHEGDRLT